MVDDKKYLFLDQIAKDIANGMLITLDTINVAKNIGDEVILMYVQNAFNKQEEYMTKNIKSEFSQEVICDHAPEKILIRQNQLDHALQVCTSAGWYHAIEALYAAGANPDAVLSFPSAHIKESTPNKLEVCYTLLLRKAPCTK